MKYLIYFATLAVLTGIQIGLFHYLAFFGAVPNLLLLFVTLWPAGLPQPVVSTLNDLQGQVIANAAIVPAGTGANAGAISVFDSSATNVVLDINGYFAQ